MTARIIVPADAPREVWMLERGEGVTASEVWNIARGGIRTWRRILEAKMNGSTFGGTKSTKAGSAREAALIDEAADHLDEVTPNRALWAAAGNDRHRATPDATGKKDGRLCVIEVKSHENGYKGDAFPMDHRAQIIWQKYVRDADLALYGAEVRDEDDMPPLGGADWQFVPDDDELLEFLILRADQFLAWRDAGCPDIDVLPKDVAVALAKWAPLKTSLDNAAKAEKAANAELKKAIANSMPHAERFGAVGMGATGGFQTTVSHTRVIDLSAWKTKDPAGYADADKLRERLASLEAAALLAHPKFTSSTSLRFQEVEARDV